MKKFLLSMAIVAIAGAGTQASAQTAPANAINGKFSVAADKQVYFSQGNLQYTQSTATWAFAEHQYDMIGTDNVTGGTVSHDAEDGDEVFGEALADKIDLFGWSGSTAAVQWGVGITNNSADYSGDFVDWGSNTIGTDAPDTWRTLTIDELEYVLSKRPDASTKRGVARINLSSDGTVYANGLILLPDTWTAPAGITFKSGVASERSVQAYADYQTFTLSDWQQLESAGAVFLPAAGMRSTKRILYAHCEVFLWTATYDDATYVYQENANSELIGTYLSERYYGRTVRLVQDVKAVGTGIAEADVTGNVETRKVLRDGQILIQRGDQTYTVMGETLK